jgi:hypothetical protein
MPSDRLPVVQTAGDLAVVDPDTGELAHLRNAPDHAILHAAEKLAEHDREVLAFKRALAAVAQERFGTGTSHAGGFGFKVAESSNWPQGPTTTALNTLVDRGLITTGDRDRCLPLKPKPEGRALNSLLSRLMKSNPEAAKLLADACTTSPPSIRDIEREAVNAEAVE